MRLAGRAGGVEGAGDLKLTEAGLAGGCGQRGQVGGGVGVQGAVGGPVQAGIAIAFGLASDPAGQLLKVTSPDQSWVGYEYDAAHRQTAVKDNLGNRIEYVLDNAGNKTGQSVKDPLGNLARSLARSIDALGRVQQTTGRE